MSNEFEEPENDEIPVEMDDVLTGVQRTVSLLNYMVGERSQLYGTIIYLMQMLEKDRVVMPTIQSMKEHHNSFYVKFGKGEDGDFFLSIEDRGSLG